jgi:hypothetical protein
VEGRCKRHSARGGCDGIGSWEAAAQDWTVYTLRLWSLSEQKGCGVGSNCCRASSSTKSYTLVVPPVPVRHSAHACKVPHRVAAARHASPSTGALPGRHACHSLRRPAGHCAQLALRRELPRRPLRRWQRGQEREHHGGSLARHVGRAGLSDVPRLECPEAERDSRHLHQLRGPSIACTARRVSSLCDSGPSMLCSPARYVSFSRATHAPYASR